MGSNQAQNLDLVPPLCCRVGEIASEKGCHLPRSHSTILVLFAMLLLALYRRQELEKEGTVS